MSSDPSRDRVLAVVTAIAQYVLEGRELPSEKLLVEELLDAGFASEEIEAAFGWLEHLSLQPRKNDLPTLSIPNHRVFTSDEVRALSAEARGFLVRLRGLGILDDTIQEEIIEKALDSSDEEKSSASCGSDSSRANPGWSSTRVRRGSCGEPGASAR